MKICIVTHFSPSKADLSEYAGWITEEWQKNKEIEKIIVLANRETGLTQKKRMGKIEILRCWDKNSLLIPFQILRKLKALEHKDKPDVIFFNYHFMCWGRNNIVNFVGAFIPLITKLAMKGKVAVILHNPIESIDLSVFKEIVLPTRLNLFAIKLATKALLGTDMVFLTLKRYVEILKNKYKKQNITYVPLGTLRSNINRPHIGGKKVLAFGYWGYKKNLPFLIKAFKNIHKKDRTIKLLVAGESHPNFPSYLKDVKNDYEAENIEFLGYVPDKDLQNIFASATVVVLPYPTTTGSSGVLHLAASFGKPVITSNLRNFRDMAKDEHLSILFFKKDDMNDFNRAIKKIVYNRKLQRKMAIANLKAAKDLYFDRISREYLKFLNR